MKKIWHARFFFTTNINQGDCGSGKSALILRYTDGIFNESYISTIGVGTLSSRPPSQKSREDFECRESRFSIEGDCVTRYTSNFTDLGTNSLLLFPPLPWIKSFLMSNTEGHSGAGTIQVRIFEFFLRLNR